MVKNLVSVLVLLSIVGGIQADEKSVLRDLRQAGAHLYSMKFHPETGVGFDGVTGTDALLSNLCEVRWLTMINFQGSDVTDAGLGKISEFVWLTHLDLSGTPVTDKGLRRLESLTGLKGISVMHCPSITAEGIDHFQKALPNCKVSR